VRLHCGRAQAFRVQVPLDQRQVIKGALGHRLHVCQEAPEMPGVVADKIGTSPAKIHQHYCNLLLLDMGMNYLLVQKR